MDDTLEELGTPKEYYRMRNSIKWIIIMWFIVICIHEYVNSMCIMEMIHDIKAYGISIVLSYSYYINVLISIMIMFLLRFVYKCNFILKFFNSNYYSV